MNTINTLLQINVTANWGSTGKIAEDISLTAMNKGWRSIVAYGRNAGPSKSELVRIGNDWDLKIHGLESRLFDNHGLASSSATKKLIQRIEEITPNIIHLHNIHGYYLNYKILFKYFATKNIPIVWTMHDCWPFTGHCAYFDYAHCDKWKMGCSSPCPCKGDYPQAVLFERPAKNWVNKKELFAANINLTIVPVSDWLGGLVKKSFLGHHPVHVIHNGIDTSIYKPLPSDAVRQKYGINNNDYVIGVASVWDRRKGFEDFIRLKRELTNNIQMVLVGLDKEKLIRAKQNGIIGIPRTENVKELVSLYSGASTFLNPSYEDNFPTTNIEALACGTPVVTYNTGGSPEAINERTGIVVEKGDVKGLCSAIMRLSINDREELGNECRRRAVENFNKNDKYMEYLTVYNGLVGGQKYVICLCKDDGKSGRNSFAFDKAERRAA